MRGGSPSSSRPPSPPALPPLPPPPPPPPPPPAPPRVPVSPCCRAPTFPCCRAPLSPCLRGPTSPHSIIETGPVQAWLGSPHRVRSNAVRSGLVWCGVVDFAVFVWVGGAGAILSGLGWSGLVQPRSLVWLFWVATGAHTSVDFREVQIGPL